MILTFVTYVDNRLGMSHG